MVTSKSKLCIDTFKVQLLMAEKCMNPYDLCGRAEINYQSYQRLMKTENCKIATLGKIAKALEVSVTDILKDVKKEQTR
jgi:DNA-binding Xre family transcriptional regulator|nr:MAG TPA: Cro/C1-type HTH DNA-binding domain protein [Caudoviricetes sp.]